LSQWNFADLIALEYHHHRHCLVALEFCHHRIGILPPPPSMFARSLHWNFSTVIALEFLLHSILSPFCCCRHWNFAPPSLNFCTTVIEFLPPPSHRNFAAAAIELLPPPSLEFCCHPRRSYAVLLCRFIPHCCTGAPFHRALFFIASVRRSFSVFIACFVTWFHRGVSSHHFVSPIHLRHAISSCRFILHFVALHHFVAPFRRRHAVPSRRAISSRRFIAPFRRTISSCHFGCFIAPFRFVTLFRRRRTVSSPSHCFVTFHWAVPFGHPVSSPGFVTPFRRSISPLRFVATFRRPILLPCFVAPFSRSVSVLLLVFISPFHRSISSL
jgi:hypothetical protein